MANPLNTKQTINIARLNEHWLCQNFKGQ